MRNALQRVAVLTVAVLGLLGLSHGVAGAAELPVWVLPGVDVGGVVGPISQLPTQALAPVYQVITLIAG
ncbi:hypothetical protein [Thermocrispum sp.]|uniref:Uncharacterized protein n=1 Tax=Thermocrispum agreste TaxID=37925 RepID=A0ABD6FKT7_9PSEU|nr:hypothetical protein [Thermocrispum sp.]